MNDIVKGVGNFLWCLAGMILVISGTRNVVVGTPKPIVNVTVEPSNASISVYAEVIEMDADKWNKFRDEIEMAIEEKARELMRQTKAKGEKE